jgi:hypothetical protein
MVIGFFFFLGRGRCVGHSIPIRAFVVVDLAKAFSSEVDTGSRQENASRQKSRARF